MSKKNSRPITVDEVMYRWSFHENSGYNDILVQSVEGNGQKLHVTQDWLHTSPDCNLLDPITPADVEHMIRFGLENGWKPDEGGTPFPCTFSKTESIKMDLR